VESSWPAKNVRDRMVIAAAETKGVKIDTHPSFCLNRLKQDLLLTKDGSFLWKEKTHTESGLWRSHQPDFQTAANATIKIPVAIVLDFPQQRYIDGKTFERKYVKSFKDAKTRAVDMAKIALNNYQNWLNRTETIQNRIYNLVQQSPSYQKDKDGALRVTRLILKRIQFPAVQCRGLDRRQERQWFRQIPGVFRLRLYQSLGRGLVLHGAAHAVSRHRKKNCASASSTRLWPRIPNRVFIIFMPLLWKPGCTTKTIRKNTKTCPWRRSGMRLKVKGSVAHDLGALPKGHALRNVSDYAWYNNNYWVWSFSQTGNAGPAQREIHAGHGIFEKELETWNSEFDHLEELDLDGDGIPRAIRRSQKHVWQPGSVRRRCLWCHIFLAGCKAMIIMADMMKDAPAKNNTRKFRQGVGAIWTIMAR